MAGKSALDEIPLDFIKAHFLQLRGAASRLRARSPISGANRWPAASARRVRGVIELRTFFPARHAREEP